MIPIMGEIAKRVIVFVLSMVPVIELRGAIPVGWGFKLPLWQTLVLSIGGNILIIPFVILLFNRVLELLRKFRLTTKIANFIEARTQRKSEKVENWVFLGLMLFVAIPLPGTGAWTASMIAGLLQMKMRKAFLPVALGVICAAVIVTLVTYGVVKIIT
ncbi:MAG: small multi-drug export protein [Clostridia bacterium]|nr:small multi-drug export protein [Clostridia bacterium]